MAKMKWAVCRNHPSYEISDCGDLRASNSHPKYQAGRRIRGVIGHDGYIMYKLDKERWVASHVLVAENFLEPKPHPDMQVAHKNGSRIMNHKSNLRWSSVLENQRDRIEHGTSPAGVANGRATITDDDVRYIRKRYAEIKLERGRVSELDQKFKLSRGHIIDIAKGVSWSHVK